jgi:hypothetical protein
MKLSGDRAIPSLKHGPDVRKEGIIAARVSSHTVDIRGGAVEFGPVRVLQTDAEVQPWPERRAAVAEWQIGELEDPAGAVWASGESAVKRRIRGATDRNAPGGQAPSTVIYVGS